MVDEASTSSSSLSAASSVGSEASGSEQPASDDVPMDHEGCHVLTQPEAGAEPVVLSHAFCLCRPLLLSMATRLHALTHVHKETLCRWCIHVGQLLTQQQAMHSNASLDFGMPREPVQQWCRRVAGQPQATGLVEAGHAPGSVRLLAFRAPLDPWVGRR